GLISVELSKFVDRNELERRCLEQTGSGSRKIHRASAPPDHSGWRLSAAADEESPRACDGESGRNARRLNSPPNAPPPSPCAQSTERRWHVAREATECTAAAECRSIR